MAHLIPFDKDGITGPAATLLFKYNDLEIDEIKEVATILNTNYNKLTKGVPLNKLNEFLYSITNNYLLEDVDSVHIVAHPFFRSMMTKINDEIDQLVVAKLVPSCIDTIRAKMDVPVFVPASVCEFIAGLLQSTMTEEQIRQTCSTGMSKSLVDERRSIGFDIDSSTITEMDLNMIIHCLKTCDLLLNNASKKQMSMEFVGRYITLFSKSNEIVPSNVCNLLDTVFRAKKFPKNVPTN